MNTFFAVITASTSIAFGTAFAFNQQQDGIPLDISKLR